VAELKTKTGQLESRIDKIENKIDQVIENQRQQHEVISVLATRSIYHEAEIQAIKRVK